jgi:hypothetical protein
MLPDDMRRIVARAMVSEHETAISRISDEIWQGPL